MPIRLAIVSITRFFSLGEACRSCCLLPNLTQFLIMNPWSREGAEVRVLGKEMEVGWGMCIHARRFQTCLK